MNLYRNCCARTVDVRRLCNTGVGIRDLGGGKKNAATGKALRRDPAGRLCGVCMFPVSVLHGSQRATEPLCLTGATGR